MLLRQFKPFYSNFRSIQTASLLFANSNEVLDKVKKEIEESKKLLQWRTPPGEKPDAFQSKLKSFADFEQNSDFITLMQQPMDLSPAALKKWWIKRKERIERHMQQYIPERHSILGSDLATAHFIVHRGGAVRFLNNPNWIRANKDMEYDLPNKYHSAYKLEAVRCDNMTLYYEGLDNIKNLQDLKFISFYNVKTFDDWCLDRMSGNQNPVLEVLDLSGTNITYRGLSAVYRMDNLKLLIIDDPKSSKELELSCALLEDCMPKLRVCPASEIHF